MMHWTPMFLVWLFLGGVILCLAIAVILSRRDGASLGMKPLTFFAIVLFCTSFLGVLLTAFSSPTLESWWQALLVRVMWQVGGGIFIAVMVWLEGKERPIQILAMVLFSIGVIIAFNPLRDLIQGPLVLRGKMDLTVTHIHIAYRGGAKIYADLHLQAADGTQSDINVSGWRATKAIEKLDGCQDGDTVELVVLRHVEQVLDAKCQ